jgi:hypothetical protein
MLANRKKCHIWFCPETQADPSQKPKEPLFANELMTFFKNIKLTLPSEF